MAEEFLRNLDLRPTNYPWPPSVLTESTVIFIQDLLRLRRQKAEESGTAWLTQRFLRAGIEPPPTYIDPDNAYLDEAWCSSLARLAQHEQLTPAQLVELVRGQHAQDYRPNKSLCPDDLVWLFQGYHHQTVMLDIARFGFRIPWLAQLPIQKTAPKNHGTARSFNSTLMRLMREGQAARQYLFLNDTIMTLWANQLFFSPLGLVPKGSLPMSEIARVIQDLSYPVNGSVNDHTDKSLLPVIAWPKIVQLAHRISQLHATNPPGTIFKGMTGDVAQAYRNLRAHADDCATFGISLPTAGVVGMDLSAPFGWNGSPNMYCVFGDGITWLVQHESPASINPTLSSDTTPFWCFNYMDDFILLEICRGHRLDAATIALKLAMIATLGPEAMNLKKFQPWQEVFIALGLQWDLSNATVSMPVVKIAKAQQRVTHLLKKGAASRNDLEKLLGTLRHVTSCIRPARAFYQSLHRVYRQFPKFGHRTLSQAAQDDLQWFDIILKHTSLSDIPTSIFASVSEPTITWYMDASDIGIAIVDYNTQRFIRLLFDNQERDDITKVTVVAGGFMNGSETTNHLNGFTINVREHFAIGLAICIWGPWLPTPQAVLQFTSKLHPTTPLR